MECGFANLYHDDTLLPINGDSLHEVVEKLNIEPSKLTTYYKLNSETYINGNS